MVSTQFVEDLMMVMTTVIGLVLANVCLLSILASLLAVVEGVRVVADFIAVLIFSHRKFPLFHRLKREDFSSTPTGA
jgi:hypothetical protein